MSQFLKIAHNPSQQSPDALANIFNTLNDNLQNINNPTSMTGLLHKLQLFSSNQQKDLEQRILKRSLDIFESSYNFSDTGDLLRAVILVVSLQKIKNPEFFDRFLKMILANVHQISYFNLLTILESYAYSKKLIVNNDKNVLIKKNETIKLLLALYEKMDGNELTLLTKVLGIVTYLHKMKKFFKDDAFWNEYDNIMQNILIKTYNIAFDIIMKNKQNNYMSKSLNIFGITDLLISLDSFQSYSSDIKSRQSKLIKFYNEMINVIIPKGYSLDKVNYQFEHAILFVKKYHVTPPSTSILTGNCKPILELIANIFKKYMDNINKHVLNTAENRMHLDNILYFMLFLIKINHFNLTKEQFNDYVQKIKTSIGPEKNLLTISKILEICSLIQAKNNIHFSGGVDEIYNTIDPLLTENIKRANLGVLGPILQIFQNLVSLNKGDIELWKYLFNIFSKKEILERLDNIDFLIKLIPSASIKTRNLFKMYTNLASFGGVHYFKQIQIDPSLTEQIENFWDSTEDILLKKLPEIYPDKFPVLLFHLVYANIGRRRVGKVFRELKDKLPQHLRLFDGKKLSQIVYSYARVKERCDDLLFQISSYLLSNPKLIEEMEDLDMVNLFWGYANLRIFDETLFDILMKKLFNRLDKLSNDSLTELCQTLSIVSIKLKPELHERLLKRLDDSIATHINNSLSENAQQTLTKSKELFLITHSNLFVIAHSLMIIDNFKTITFWERFFQFLILNKKYWDHHSSYVYYIYLIYFHASIQNLNMKYEKELYDALYNHLHEIVSYMKNKKKNYVSEMEQKVKKILEVNAKNWLNIDQQQENNIIRELTMNLKNHNVIYIENINKFKDLYGKTKIKKGTLIFPYTIDLILGQYAIEINGKWHYFINNKGETYLSGYDQLKKNVIEAASLKYIEIPYTAIIDSDEKATEKNIFNALKEKQ